MGVPQWSQGERLVGCVLSLGKEESADGASVSAGRQDEVESPEQTPEEQVEEVRGEEWNL